MKKGSYLRRYHWGSLRDNLPSLPQILDDLIQTLGNLNITLDQIEEQIRIDQSISLEILKVVNKGEFLEPDEKVTSIRWNSQTRF